jgi:hypothetical protein
MWCWLRSSEWMDTVVIPPSDLGVVFQLLITFVIPPLKELQIGISRCLVHQFGNIVGIANSIFDKLRDKAKILRSGEVQLFPVPPDSLAYLSELLE